jgi:hypothetical protein
MDNADEAPPGLSRGMSSHDLALARPNPASELLALDLVRGALLTARVVECRLPPVMKLPTWPEW